MYLTAKSLRSSGMPLDLETLLRAEKVSEILFKKSQNKVEIPKEIYYFPYISFGANPIADEAAFSSRQNAASPARGLAPKLVK